MTDHTDKDEAIKSISAKIDKYLQEGYTLDIKIEATKFEYGGIVKDKTDYSITERKKK